jgi:hypothetical protein
MFNLLLRDVTRLCKALHTISFWIVFVVNPSLSLGLRWLRNSQRLHYRGIGCNTTLFNISMGAGSVSVRGQHRKLGVRCKRWLGIGMILATIECCF